MKNDIAKQLIESFNYVYEATAGEKPSAIGQNSITAAQTGTDMLASTAKGTLGKVANKASGPLAIFAVVYDGYQRISKLPTDMPRDQYTEEVTKIVAKLVADYGVFWVGSVLGGIIAGAFTGGAGAVVGMIAGGLLASYALGDTVDEIVEKIVDILYTEDGAEQQTGDTSSQPDDSLPSEQDAHSAISEIQSKLQQSGLDIGPTGVDGKFGPKTAAALLSFQKTNNFPTTADALAALINVEAKDPNEYRFPDVKLSESERIAHIRDTLNNIEEGAGWQNFGRGILGKKVTSKVDTTAGERAAQHKKYGYKDAKRAPNALEKGANIAGRSLRGTAKGVGSVVLGALKLSGYALKFAWNHKFLALVAGIGAYGAYGYFLDPNGNLISNLIPQIDGPQPNPPDNNNIPNPPDNNNIPNPNINTTTNGNDIVAQNKAEWDAVQAKNKENTTAAAKQLQAKLATMGIPKAEQEENLRRAFPADADALINAAPKSVAESIAAFRNLIDNIEK